MSLIEAQAPKNGNNKVIHITLCNEKIMVLRCKHEKGFEQNRFNVPVEEL